MSDEQTGPFHETGTGWGRARRALRSRSGTSRRRPSATRWRPSTAAKTIARPATDPRAVVAPMAATSPTGNKPAGGPPRGGRPYGDRPQGQRSVRRSDPRASGPTIALWPAIRPQGGGRPYGGNKPYGNKPGGPPRGGTTLRWPTPGPAPAWTARSTARDDAPILRCRTSRWASVLRPVDPTSEADRDHDRRVDFSQRDRLSWPASTPRGPWDRDRDAGPRRRARRLGPARPLRVQAHPAHRLRRPSSGSVRAKRSSPADVLWRRPLQLVVRPRRLLVVPERRAALDQLVLHATTLRIPVVRGRGRHHHRGQWFRRPPGCGTGRGTAQAGPPLMRCWHWPSRATNRPSCWRSTTSRTPRTWAPCFVRQRPVASTASSSRPAARHP